MKKIVSVLLATWVLCSCLAMMVISTSAGVEYPDGREGVFSSPINGEPFVQQRIYNTYYSGMNCFIARGVLKYYQNEPQLFPLVEGYCFWVITYATETPDEDDYESLPAVPDYRLVFEYSSGPVFWDTTRTVTQIQLDHELYFNGEACFCLSSVYTPE